MLLFPSYLPFLILFALTQAQRKTCYTNKPNGTLGASNADMINQFMSGTDATM